MASKFCRVEIRRIVVQSQPGQIVGKTLSQKNPSQYRIGGVAQIVGPEFKPQYSQKNIYIFFFAGNCLHFRILYLARLWGRTTGFHLPFRGNY
jgi:hypothetical protein